MQVSCGEAHAACLLEDGTVWVWGCAANQRFGSSSSMDVFAPVRMTVFDKHKVRRGLVPFHERLRALFVFCLLLVLILLFCSHLFLLLAELCVRILSLNQSLELNRDYTYIRNNTEWTDSYSWRR
jgi:hypothetical protein